MYMQYTIMVIISIKRFTLVLPVPVTEFKQMVATDINKIANPTIRNTGSPNVKKDSS